MINHVRFSSGRKEMNRRYQKSDYTVTSLRASEQASLSYIKKYLPLTYFKFWNELSRCWSWAIFASWASSQLWLLVSSSSIDSDSGTFIKKESLAFKFGRASDASASDGRSLTWKLKEWESKSCLLAINIYLSWQSNINQSIWKVCDRLTAGASHRHRVWVQLELEVKTYYIYSLRLSMKELEVHLLLCQSFSQ